MSKTVFVVVLACLFAAIGPSAVGQYDPEAKRILDGMSAKYKSIPSFTAKIIYSIEDVESDLMDSRDIEIGIKGKKIHMTTDDQEIIISDGLIWTLIDTEIELDNYDPDESDISPTNIYDIYRKGYKYILFGQETIDGKAYHVIDLSPEDKDSEYFRIRLIINKVDSSLRKFTLNAKSGNKYIYDINEFDPEADLPDNFFRFDTTKFDVIDLRIGY